MTGLKINLDKKQVDKIVLATIEGLEKKIRSLEAKLRSRDSKLANMDKYMDLTKESRAIIRSLANDLFESLEDAKFIEVERYDD